MGRNRIPWHSVRRLELNPGDDMEAFEPAQFIESLTAYMSEPINPALPLEELVFAFPTLRQATEVSSEENEFCQTDLYHIFRNLRPSALRSLSLCRIESFKWTQPVLLLPSVTFLSLDGYGDLTPTEEFDHFLGFLESFPALQELRLSGFDILRETAADPTTTSCDAETLARLSSRKLACLGPSLVILLFTLQCTKVTKVAYRESLTASDEMRWQREPGGAFKGERWTLC
ncbi:RHTO0S06e03796g1_1 [Rhodotorula toruloides]|uniref:RHTO0S06e03796g1_1 n=1 Tax=Rhodotorula toruloides TaxID=5286 RepID=A0A061AWR0_RHOTO|nr:RHTO0S06e03796g1_1 [Rhodotorula toruloides]